MLSPAPLKLRDLLAQRPLAGLAAPGAPEALSRPLVMGVVNVTPDSFYDGSRTSDPEAAAARALALADAGADLLDIGGESTRPRSQGVPEAEELARVVPVLRALAGRTRVPLSVDTSKASVAEAALEAGASILNDVTALRGDPRMAEVAARCGAPVILMHMRGSPRDMQEAPAYADVVGEVEAFLLERARAFVRAGGDPGQVLVDPGLGFGKTLGHNLELLKALPRLARIAPVVIGASRKSFLGRLAAGQDPEEEDLPPGGLPPASARLPASLAAALFAASRGAAVLRVHDVAETRQALRVWRLLA